MIRPAVSQKRKRPDFGVGPFQSLSRSCKPLLNKGILARFGSFFNPMLGDIEMGMKNYVPVRTYRRVRNGRIEKVCAHMRHRPRPHCRC